MLAASDTNLPGESSQEGDCSSANLITPAGESSAHREEAATLRHKIFSPDIDFKAIQVYADLARHDANTRANSNPPEVTLEALVTHEMEWGDQLEGIRRKMLSKMNLVTVEKLATILGCDSSNSLVELEMIDPRKRPVIEALVEFDRIREECWLGIEQMLASKLKSIAAASNMERVPALPCTLLEALRLAVRGEKIAPGILFKSFLRFWDTHPNRFEGEIASLRAQALAGTKGPNFWIKESKSVTQITTLHWIVIEFGKAWQESPERTEPNATPEARALTKKRKKGAAAGNNSRETQKWLTICEACVERFESTQLPDTVDDRKRALDEFLIVANATHGKPFPKDPRSRALGVEFLGAILNLSHPEPQKDQIHTVLRQLQRPQEGKRKKRFKAVTPELLEHCWIILGKAGLISPVKNA